MCPFGAHPEAVLDHDIEVILDKGGAPFCHLESPDAVGCIIHGIYGIVRSNEGERFSPSGVVFDFEIQRHLYSVLDYEDTNNLCIFVSYESSIDTDSPCQHPVQSGRKTKYGFQSYEKGRTFLRIDL